MVIIPVVTTRAVAQVNYQLYTIHRLILYYDGYCIRFLLTIYSLYAVLASRYRCTPLSIFPGYGRIGLLRILLVGQNNGRPLQGSVFFILHGAADFVGIDIYIFTVSVYLDFFLADFFLIRVTDCNCIRALRQARELILAIFPSGLLSYLLSCLICQCNLCSLHRVPVIVLDDAMDGITIRRHRCASFFVGSRPRLYIYIGVPMRIAYAGHDTDKVLALWQPGKLVVTCAVGGGFVDSLVGPCVVEVHRCSLNRSSFSVRYITRNRIAVSGHCDIRISCTIDHRIIVYLNVSGALVYKGPLNDYCIGALRQDKLIMAVRAGGLVANELLVLVIDINVSALYRLTLFVKDGALQCAISGFAGCINNNFLQFVAFLAINADVYCSHDSPCVMVDNLIIAIRHTLQAQLTIHVRGHNILNFIPGVEEYQNALQRQSVLILYPSCNHTGLRPRFRQRRYSHNYIGNDLVRIVDHKRISGGCVLLTLIAVLYADLISSVGQAAEGIAAIVPSGSITNRLSPVCCPEIHNSAASRLSITVQDFTAGLIGIVAIVAASGAVQHNGHILQISTVNGDLHLAGLAGCPDVSCTDCIGTVGQATHMPGSLIVRGSAAHQSLVTVINGHGSPLDWEAGSVFNCARHPEGTVNNCALCAIHYYFHPVRELGEGLLRHDEAILIGCPVVMVHIAAWPGIAPVICRCELRHLSGSYTVHGKLHIEVNGLQAVDVTLMIPCYRCSDIGTGDLMLQLHGRLRLVGHDSISAGGIAHQHQGIHDNIALVCMHGKGLKHMVPALRLVASGHLGRQAGTLAIGIQLNRQAFRALSITVGIVIPGHGSGIIRDFCIPAQIQGIKQCAADLRSLTQFIAVVLYGVARSFQSGGTGRI